LAQTISYMTPAVCSQTQSSKLGTVEELMFLKTALYLATRQKTLTILGKEEHAFQKSTKVYSQ